MVSIKLNADASQAKQEIESYTERIKEMNAQLAESNKAGDYGQSVKLTQGIDALMNAQRQYMMMANQSIAQQNNLQAQANNQAGNTIVNTANNAGNAVSALSSGNFAAAAIQASRGGGNMLRTLGVDIAGRDGLGVLGKALGAAGIAGIVASAGIAAGNALSEQYEKSLTPMTDFQRKFGQGIGEKSGLRNADEALAWFNKAGGYARDTGLSTDDFLRNSADMARYGLADSKTVMEMTRGAALTANATGADIAALQNLQGIAARYGDNSDVLKTANKALYATGMVRGQFDEFLHSLQSVIEDGISKGYIKSTEDVSKNLAMFARLGGTADLWRGEQGARRLQQMNGGLAGATNMQSVSDMVVYSAARDVLNNPDFNSDFFNVYETDEFGKKHKVEGMNRSTGTYIDSLLLMENGVSPEMINAIRKNVQGMEGNNIAGQIERYKDIYKLNYAGAVDVYNMMKNPQISAEELSKKIESMQSDEKFMSDETKKQNALNDIRDTVVGMGRDAFTIKYDGMQGIAGNVDAIYKLLAKDESGKINPDIQKEIASSGASAEQAAMAEKQVLTKYGALNKSSRRVEGVNGGFNLSTSIASSALADAGAYAESVDRNLKNISLMTDSGLINNRLTGGSLYGKLYDDSTGNEELDRIFKEKVGEYSYAKNGGKIKPYDIAKVINEAEKGKGFLGAGGKSDVMSAYEEGNQEKFIRALESMLRNLFEGSTLHTD